MPRAICLRLSLLLAACGPLIAQGPTPTPVTTPTPKSKATPTPGQAAIIELPTNGHSVFQSKQSIAKSGDCIKQDRPGQALAEGGTQILSDTKGVDFGPYMRRMHVVVQEHWYPLIPEIALPPVCKYGKVTIELAIIKDGSLSAMKVTETSGDAVLDRAAYGALANSVPFPKLPSEFTGDHLLLRSVFFYNPGRMSAEPSPQPPQIPSPSPAPSQSK